MGHMTALDRAEAHVRSALDFIDPNERHDLDAALEELAAARAECERLRAALPYPSPQYVSKEETIERLCDLLGKVWERFEPGAHEPCDCFCGKNDVVKRNALRFRSSGQALAWVEAVVMRALAESEGGG